MKRIKSIVTVEGFERSYVDINDVLKKKGIVPGGGSDAGSEGDTAPDKSLIFDTPVVVVGFDEPLTKGQDVTEILNNEQTINIASYIGADDTVTVVDSTNGKVYTLSLTDTTAAVVDIADLEDGIIYYDAVINSYVTFSTAEPGSTTERLLAIATSVGSARIHHNGEQEVGGVGTYSAETAVIGLYPGVYYKAMNDDYDGIEVLEFILEDAVLGHSLYPVINFMGRFLAKVDNVGISLPQGVLPAEANPDIEAGHVYEYSILDGVFSIIDVTPHVE